MLEIFGKGIVLLSTYGTSEQGSMVKLMSTEWKKEYEEMVRSGLVVDERVATNFINAQKIHHNQA